MLRSDLSFTRGVSAQVKVKVKDTAVLLSIQSSRQGVEISVSWRSTGLLDGHSKQQGIIEKTYAIVVLLQ